MARDMHVAKYSLGLFYHDSKLKVGDTCHHALSSNDFPPKGNENMPRRDMIDKPRIHNVSMKELKEESEKGI